MNTAYNISVAAMQSAQAQLAGAARQIANPRADDTGIIDAVVAVRQAEATHATAAALVRTTSDMTDHLLDILA